METNTLQAKDFERVIDLVLDFCGRDFVGDVTKKGPASEESKRPEEELRMLVDAK